MPAQLERAGAGRGDGGLDRGHVGLVLGHDGLEELHAVEVLLGDVVPVPRRRVPAQLEVGRRVARRPHAQERERTGVHRHHEVREDAERGRGLTPEQRDGRVVVLLRHHREVAEGVVLLHAEPAVPVGQHRHRDRLVVVEQRRVVGVHRAHVVHLEEGVDHELPVAGQLVHLRAHSAHGGAVDLGHLRGDGTEELEQRDRIDVLVDEDPSVPCLAAHRDEAQRSRVEVREAPPIGHRLERAVGAVGPRVVLAGQSPGRAAVVAGHRRATVATGVVERPQDAVVATDDDDGRSGPGREPIGAWLGPLRLVPGEQPAAGEDPLLLQLVERGIRVAPGRDERHRDGVGRRGGARLLLVDALPDRRLECCVHGSPCRAPRGPLGESGTAVRPGSTSRSREHRKPNRVPTRYGPSENG